MYAGSLKVLFSRMTILHDVESLKTSARSKNNVSKHDVWEDILLHLNLKVSVDLQEGRFEKSFVLVSL